MRFFRGYSFEVCYLFQNNSSPIISAGRIIIRGLKQLDCTFFLWNCFAKTFEGWLLNSWQEPTSVKSDGGLVHSGTMSPAQGAKVLWQWNFVPCFIYPFLYIQFISNLFVNISFYSFHSLPYIRFISIDTNIWQRGWFCIRFDWQYKYWYVIQYQYVHFIFLVSLRVSRLEVRLGIEDRTLALLFLVVDALNLLQSVQ